jgi:hypothetical protein
MPNLQDNYNLLATSISNSVALYRHCLSPRAIHTEAAIEAAFLQIQKSWELFLEDQLLLILAGSRPTVGVINAFFSVNDVEIARKIVFQENRYLEWTNVEDIEKRYSSFMSEPNQIINSLNLISLDLKEIKTLRNFIAHSSKIARINFEKLCTNKFGGSPAIIKAADYLSRDDRLNPGFTFFEIYAKHLEICAAMMVA